MFQFHDNSILQFDRFGNIHLIRFRLTLNNGVIKCKSDLNLKINQFPTAQIN